MDTIRCDTCGASYGLRPDGHFRCDGDKAHARHAQDIDLDGSDVWAVDSAGTLVIVADPAVTAEWARHALEAFFEDEPGSWGEGNSMRSFLEAADDLIDAARAGLPIPNNP
ncbi:hypothetical protein ACLF6K_17350 [Streptomyces xanthophaeus]|uniref:hypothetical protein n=1 Tax=Streptomyces xanthophaeus TaxID=67385 RepID=UPI00398FEA8D